MYNINASITWPTPYLGGGGGGGGGGGIHKREGGGGGEDGDGEDGNGERLAECGKVRERLSEKVQCTHVAQTNRIFKTGNFA